jgi:hypothetical protein
MTLWNPDCTNDEQLREGFIEKWMDEKAMKGKIIVKQKTLPKEVSLQ